MNKSIKILLLLFAVLLSFGAVMYFYKTIVSPPKATKFTNQYKNSVNKDLQLLVDGISDSKQDSLYNVIIEGLNFESTNKLIDNKDKDELTDNFIKKYVPIYVKSCNSKFKQSVWNEEVLKSMQTHIKELHDLKTSNGTVLIGGDLNSSLNEVANIIVRYYGAKAAASVGGYNGLQSARQKISSARNYAKMSPLSNNQQLVSNLNSVASRLNQEHVNYLANQVETMRYWRNYSEDSYDNLAMEVSNKLKEYKINAASVYGSALSISHLETRASEYYNATDF